MFIAVWLVISLAVTSANIVYPVRNETTGLIQSNRSSVFFTYLPWNRDFTVSHVALVDIYHNVSVFNYCDVNEYTQPGVERLLQSHHIPLNQSWVAVVSKNNIVPECMDINKDLSREERYILNHPKRHVQYIQSLGNNVPSFHFLLHHLKVNILIYIKI